MLTDTQRITAEIAHVLFMDLVGYSKLSMEEQARLAGGLREIVRRTPEFERGEARGDLIRLDTGDGMALVFFRDPIAPIQCAVEIATALKSRPDILLRMGVHSGPVSRIPDINGKDNVSGSGINMAQRVMDCGDEGHILHGDGVATSRVDADRGRGKRRKLLHLVRSPLAAGFDRLLVLDTRIDSIVDHDCR